MVFLPRRVHGLETEYGLSARVQTRHGWRRLGTDEAAQVLFAPVVQEHSATNTFLRNGGRLYLDVGSHPEYATAECSSLLDLVTQDAAGDLICDQLCSRAVQKLAGEGITARISLFKNNTDSHGNSYGSHENYQIARAVGLEKVVHGLTPFLVTRQLIAGAGKWVSSPRGGHFELSQRAHHMWDPMSSATTRTRPMVNTRDEPHADPNRFRRLHVIVGDSNLSRSTVWLKFGATELVLRALEDGVVFDDLALVDPGVAIRQVSADVTGRASVEGRNGPLTALGVQRAIWERVAEFCADDPQLVSSHALWGEVLDAVADRRLARVATRIDWVIKLRMMSLWLLRAGAPASRNADQLDQRLAQLDLSYHDIHAGQGLYAAARRRGLVDEVVGDRFIQHATNHPPADTRAALRGRFVQAAQAHRRDHTVDWMSFTVHDLSDGAVRCTDPLSATDARVDALIERIAAEPRTHRARVFHPPPV